MKRKLAKVLAFVLVFTLLGSSFAVMAEDDGTVYMYIDENTVVKTVEPEMYGINFEWGDGKDGHVSIKNGTTEINPSYVEALDGILPMGRAAGMSANRLFWKGAIGDYADRTTQKFWWRNPQKQYYGPMEWIKANMAADPNTKFIMAVNLYDSQENIADLVEFLCGDGTVNYNGGTDWAKRRKELGVENPVNIMAFELGNELDAGSEGGWNEFRYAEACKRTIRTIRSVNPDAKIAIMRKTGGGDYWTNWHKQVLIECGEEIDYIISHNYPNYPDIGTLVTTNTPKIMADVKNILGDDTKIKVIFTEHAMYPLDMNNVGTPKYNSPHAMIGVLGTAEWLLRASFYPPIVAASYHAITSANWAVVYEEGGKVKRTAIGDLLRMFAKYFVGDNLDVQQSGFVYNKPDNVNYIDVAGAALKSENGINLVLMNQREEESTFNFTFSDKSYKAVQMSQISGPTLLSDNYTGKHEITYIEDEKIDTGYLKEYKVPPLSVTVLNLVECEPDEKLELNGEIASSKALALDKNLMLLNGLKLKLRKEPLMINDRFYIPVEVAEDLFELTANLSTDSKELKLDSDKAKFVFKLGDSVYYKDGTEVQSVAPTILDGDNVYIPIKALADEFSYKTYWDDRGFVVLRSNIFPDMDANKDTKLLDYVNNWFIEEGGK